MRRWFIIIGSLIIGTAPIRANDANIAFGGKNVQVLDNENIQMISENIKVNIDAKELEIIANDVVINCTCTFIFKNTTEKNQQVRIGFPGVVKGYEINSSEMTDFNTYINNKKVNVSIQTDTTDSATIDDGTVHHKTKWVYNHQNWYIWNVSFRPNETLSIVNTYNTVLSASMPNSWFEYVTTTGKVWKGSIAKADFQIKLQNIQLEKYLSEISPKGYTRKKGIIEWHFVNWEPRENIKVKFTQFMK